MSNIMNKTELEGVIGDFQSYCKVLSEEEKGECAETVRAAYTEAVYGPANEQLATKGGDYGYIAMLKRATPSSIDTARNAGEFFLHQITSKFQHSLATRQGAVYNALADAFANETRYAKDNRFDHSSIRNGKLPVVEIKSSDNTTNDASFTGSIRKLRRNCWMAAQDNDEPVMPVVCFLNAPTSISVENCNGQDRNGNDNENKDLSDFYYLKICGKYALCFLFGVDSFDELASMKDGIWSVDLQEYHIGQRQSECLEQYEKACRKHKLDPHDLHSLLALKDIL